MKRKMYVFDGVKSVQLWDEETDAWKYLSGNPKSSQQDNYRLIPTIFRGVNMISNDVSKMPFVIKKGDKEIDNSQNYQNVLEFLPNPRRLFSLLSMSLDLTGSAYAIPIMNKAGFVKELRYVVSGTIAPIYDQKTGELLSLNRTINSQPPQAYKPGLEMLYWWLPDPDVENGAPLGFPAKAAQNAAGVLNNLDLYVAQYFDHSAIRPFVITVAGDPPEDVRDRMREWFNSLWGGIKKAFKMEVFNAGAVTVTQVGDGLDQLQNQELNDDKRKDVAQALGIPYALLFSEAANNATLGGDQLFYYQNTVEPRCEFISSVFQEQLFTPNPKYKDYRIEFMPESLDVYQEDENARSQSLTQYVNAGYPLLMASDILGIELTEEQRAELEAMAQEKKDRADELTNRLANSDNQNNNQNSNQEEDNQQDDNQRDEIAKWRRKSLRAFKAGKSANCQFESYYLPADICNGIVEKLIRVKCEADIDYIFNKALYQPKSTEELIGALREFTQALTNG